MNNNIFQPFSLNSIQLNNRFVMAPMTRSKAPNNIPNENTALYYQKRVQGGVGLIITEGTYINPFSGENSFTNPKNVPNFFGEEALIGWKKVVEAVHKVGGKIFPQLWHVGGVRQPGLYPEPTWSGFGPSAVTHPHTNIKEPAKEMTLKDIENTIHDYVKCAVSAKAIGFDGIELHGAHGYLIDQFFWEKTNLRTDIYGGKLLKERTHFACEIIKSIRKNVGPDYPICFRFSQWKLGDYKAKLANSPKELESFLLPLLNAGVNIFHASSRNIFDPEFENSHLNLAGWTKKMTGMPTITVGSVGLNQDFIDSFLGKTAASNDYRAKSNIEELQKRLLEGEFDLIALGRALIADPNWVNKANNNNFDEIISFNKTMLEVYP
ncbi:MAG: NADH:flavin oxidoreductase [Bdellovibrionota bacterium]